MYLITPVFELLTSDIFIGAGFLISVVHIISGPEVIKLFSCSTQMSMKLIQPINFKMPTIVGILTFMSRKNSIKGISEPVKSRISSYFIPMNI